MSSRDRIVLKKIIQYADEIELTIKQLGLAQEAFSTDFIAKNAISMCILQIGELVGKLSDEFKLENSSIPWRDIKAMRNIAAHNYGEIDVDILWETVVGDIPELKNFCESQIK